MQNFQGISFKRTQTHSEIWKSPLVYLLVVNEWKVKWKNYYQF